MLVLPSQHFDIAPLPVLACRVVSDFTVKPALPHGLGKLVAKGGIEPLASGYEPANSTSRLSAIALNQRLLRVEQEILSQAL